jgi:outer membrane protein assembly factor BamE
LQQKAQASIIAPSFYFVVTMRFRSIQALLAIGCLIVALSGCVYRMDVPQGNRVDPELAEKLEIGMSKSQVEFLLGTPAVVDIYRPDQWHYILFRKTGDDGAIFQRRLTLTFTNELLTNIEGSLNPI